MIDALLYTRPATNRPPDYLTEKQRSALEMAFCAGSSIRSAAALAGVAKGTAMRFLQRQGGRDAYRQRGATFKQNRWK
jgi:DNA-directed RNA polymerase specialized sigma24 family protein